MHTVKRGEAFAAKNSVEKIPDLLFAATAAKQSQEFFPHFFQYASDFEVCAENLWDFHLSQNGANLSLNFSREKIASEFAAIINLILHGKHKPQTL